MEQIVRNVSFTGCRRTKWHICVIFVQCCSNCNFVGFFRTSIGIIDQSIFFCINCTRNTSLDYYYCKTLPAVKLSREAKEWLQWLRVEKIPSLNGQERLPQIDYIPAGVFARRNARLFASCREFSAAVCRVFEIIQPWNRGNRGKKRSEMSPRGRRRTYFQWKWDPRSRASPLSPSFELLS